MSGEEININNTNNSNHENKNPSESTHEEMIPLDPPHDVPILPISTNEKNPSDPVNPHIEPDLETGEMKAETITQQLKKLGPYISFLRKIFCREAVGRTV